MNTSVKCIGGPIDNTVIPIIGQVPPPEYRVPIHPEAPVTDDRPRDDLNKRYVPPYALYKREYRRTYFEYMYVGTVVDTAQKDVPNGN